MNFALRYTLHHFCIFLFARCFWFRLHCKKQRAKPPPPSFLSPLFSVSPQFSFFLLPSRFFPSVCIIVITTVIVCYRSPSPPPLLLPSFSFVIHVFIFACPNICNALFVPVVPEEKSHKPRDVRRCHIAPFLLCIRGYLNFCSNKLLVELVWI